MFMPNKQYGLGEIAVRVGETVFRNTVDALGDGELRDLVYELSNLRARSVDNPDYSRLIGPFMKTLKGAALSSAHNTGNTVAANAMTIEASVGETLTHQEQVAATRASHHLALAHPMVHIGDMGVVSLIVRDYTNATFMGRSFREDILRYDPQTRKTVLAKGLQEWHISPMRTIADTADKNEDVQVGCPFSFAPKNIRVGYYETMVDLFDENSVWPQLMRSMLGVTIDFDTSKYTK